MRLGGSSSPHSSDHDDNPYWISFSDIMAGLLVIFILASLALILELTETKYEVSDAIREIAKAEQVRRNILNEIEEDLRKKDIYVEISDNHTVLRIPEDILTFKNNRHCIPKTEGMRETALEIGHALFLTITRNSRWKYLDTIFIEGHTDRRPSPSQMGNWGLSTRRAISVWNYWNENLPDDLLLHDLKNHNGDPLFSVSGYAETRPAQIIQETEADFKKNRRIDIRITVRRPALEEFKNIKKLLEE